MVLCSKLFELNQRRSWRKRARVPSRRPWVLMTISEKPSVFMSNLTTHEPAAIVSAGVVGFLGYGTSLVLFVLALRLLGSARTGAYFSTAPFIGAIAAAVALHDPLDGRIFLAAILMAAGVWLHLTERHDHEHQHEALEHTHAHVHDEHHRHAHGPGIPAGEPHSHPHQHEPLRHSHPHFPDLHHRHHH